MSYYRRQAGMSSQLNNRLLLPIVVGLMFQFHDW